MVAGWCYRQAMSPKSVYRIIVALFIVGLPVVIRMSASKNTPNFEDDLERNNIMKRILTDRNGSNKSCTPDLKLARFYSQSGEDKALYERYFSSPPVCNGVYLEIGALDGIRYSNTMFYETTLNWTGILIEAQPQNAAKLMNNRKGHNVIIPEAVCKEGQGHVNFTGSAAVGGVPDEMPEGHRKRFIHAERDKLIKVPCRPIGAMLRGAGVKSIDFFILDVEGAELMVLDTMDWSIPVGLFIVEMGRGHKDKLLIDLLAQKGYKKSQWNIMDHCPPKHDCADNQVFENVNFAHGQWTGGA